MNQTERMDIIKQRLCDSIRILEHNKDYLEDPCTKEIYCNINDAMNRIESYDGEYISYLDLLDILADDWCIVSGTDYLYEEEMGL